MKASTESLDEGTHAPGQTQSIICGGGWKTPPKQYHLKINAICGVFLTIAAAAAGIGYYPVFGAFGFIPTSVLLISTILLFRFERAATSLGPQDGDHDIRNLYGQTGTRREKYSTDQPHDNKVA
jgi:hypothetical protein